MKRLLSFLLAFILTLSLASCGSSNNSSAPAPEQPQQESSEPAPSTEPEPEPDPEPIVIPDPVVYSGSGDDVLEINPLDGVWMMHITGNHEGRHFSVKGYDASGNNTDLFVNTTDPYDGITIDPSQLTSTLEITATGEWTVELISAYTAQAVSVDAPISGTGDSVLAVTLPDALWAFKISGNKDSHHFAVRGYDWNLNVTDLFVNTTDPYDGSTIDLSQSTVLLAVTSESDWTVELSYLRDLQEANQGDTITGTGDCVFMVDKAGKTAHIKGNPDSHHFAVKMHSMTDGDLLVNTTDPYDGTVMLKFDPLIMVVSAEGEWSITLN